MHWGTSKVAPVKMTVVRSFIKVLAPDGGGLSLTVLSRGHPLNRGDAD
jgi:hypothetical protein